MRNPTIPPLSTLILAGGLSRRFGQDKRLLRLWGCNGPTLLEHSIQLVQAVSAEVLVVLNDPEQWSHLATHLVRDCHPNGGALGGIYSGLQAMRYEHALVVACDMPLLNPALLQFMADQPRTYDILIPRSLRTGVPRNPFAAETLHAIYGKTCLGAIQATLEAGQRRITDIFPQLQVRYLDPAAYRHLDPDGFSFLNINTLEDVMIAQQALRSRCSGSGVQ